MSGLRLQISKSPSTLYKDPYVKCKLCGRWNGYSSEEILAIPDVFRDAPPCKLWPLQGSIAPTSLWHHPWGTGNVPRIILISPWWYPFCWMKVSSSHCWNIPRKEHVLPDGCEACLLLCNPCFSPSKPDERVWFYVMGSGNGGMRKILMLP